MENKIIRLTESDLHKIVKKSVCKILVNEGLLDGLFGKKRKHKIRKLEKSLKTMFIQKKKCSGYMIIKTIYRLLRGKS